MRGNNGQSCENAYRKRRNLTPTAGDVYSRGRFQPGDCGRFGKFTIAIATVQGIPISIM